ncbi:transposase [Escherichia coli]|uniref:transposase n=1 Tax=Escherichia coli TaxID=562 RepID=UPI003D7B734B
MSLSASPAVSGTSVFRQKVKYQLRFTLQHQWSGWMLAWLNPATLSDGTVFEPVNSFQKNQKKLASTSATVKPQGQIQRLHSCIANIRRDYLHKVTTTVSKNHAMIVIEDLKVSNMSKSAAGTVSQPGRNVRAKSGF